MTSERRFERDLPDLLAELAAGAPPNYRDDIVQRVAATRQRPAWTFPERWLPMAVVSRRPAVAFNVPWRSLALVALLAALLAIAAGIYVASRPRGPAPYGLAANGQIAYSLEGDIQIRDSATGAATTIVGGPAQDVAPSFSLDGTRVAFIRLSDDLRPTETLMVADADGRNVRPVAGPERGLSWWVWSPSGKEIAIVSTANGAELSIVSTDGEPVRRVIDLPVGPETVEWRPPDGRELIVRGIRGAEYSLYAVGADGVGFRQIAPDLGHARQYLAPLSFSPDGRLLAYGSFDDFDRHLSLYLLDLDTGTERVRPSASPPPSARPGSLVHDGSPVFAPDGRSLAYIRYFNEKATGTITAQVFEGLLDGPDTSISPATTIPSGTRSLYAQFSPDGGSVLMYRLPEGDVAEPEPRQPQSFLADDVWHADLASRSPTRLGWTASDVPTWQRRAP